MPHLLTSNELPGTDAPRSVPSSPTRLEDYRRAHEVDPDLEPLRRQVSTIIDAILADNTPEEAEVREKLRWHVARNPGRPEKALMGHLLSMSARREAAG
ncbi:hypothetical protein ACQCSU_16035 [Pseudarthrobacter sp. O4]|uniref:hypothetical protein n=1 Tax=Pseudarthrobacter sp. O4 TaxID=3418417 RepID=UPI003CE77D8D